MELLAALIVTTVIAGIGSGALGAGIATLFDLDSNRTMSILLSFAAGLMLAIVCFDFIPEAIELEEGVGHAATVCAVVAAGAAVVGGLDHVIERRSQKHAHCCAIDDPAIAELIDEKTREEHIRLHDDLARQHDHGHAGHGHGHSHGHSHHHIDLDSADPSSLKVAGVVMALAIAMHNLPAGISIGASFASSSTGMLTAGVIIAVLIGIHSIPESMSLAVPFLHAGYSKGKTILIAGAVGAMMVVGALIGFALGEVGTFWLAMSLAFASGAMLYVLFGELLPESFMLFHSKKPTVAVIAGIILGILIIQLG